MESVEGMLLEYQGSEIPIIIAARNRKLLQFFPESPFEFASVFVHEFAHLLGLSHDSGGKCECRDWQKCLRIE